MSKIKLKYIADSSEECKGLEEALSFFSSYFRLDISKDNSIVIVESTKPIVKNLEGKFEEFSKTQGIAVYPEKEIKINGIYNENKSTIDYSIFYFNSSKEDLTIGLQPREDKKYLFEVYYENPNFKK